MSRSTSASAYPCHRHHAPAPRAPISPAGTGPPDPAVPPARAGSAAAPTRGSSRGPETRPPEPNRPLFGHTPVPPGASRRPGGRRRGPGPGHLTHCPQPRKVTTGRRDRWRCLPSGRRRAGANRQRLRRGSTPSCIRARYRSGSAETISTASRRQYCGDPGRKPSVVAPRCRGARTRHGTLVHHEAAAERRRSARSFAAQRLGQQGHRVVAGGQAGDGTGRIEIRRGWRWPGGDGQAIAGHIGRIGGVGVQAADDLESRSPPPERPPRARCVRHRGVLLILSPVPVHHQVCSEALLDRDHALGSCSAPVEAPRRSWLRLGYRRRACRTRLRCVCFRGLSA